MLLEQVRGLIRHVLELAPAQRAELTVEALVHHRELVGRVLVAAVSGDVVALGNAPHVLCTDVLVTDHESSRSPRSNGGWWSLSRIDC